VPLIANHDGTTSAQQSLYQNFFQGNHSETNPASH
jgi:hypothetical protein